MVYCSDFHIHAPLSGIHSCWTCWFHLKDFMHVWSQTEENITGHDNNMDAATISKARKNILLIYQNNMRENSFYTLFRKIFYLLVSCCWLTLTGSESRGRLEPRWPSEAEPSFPTATEGLIRTIESLVCVQRRGYFRVAVIKAVV